MKIAFFDSGLGGLSVLHLALERLKNEEFLYYADKDNVPYGLKSREEILNFTTKSVEFLIKQGAKAVVIACNTATSVAINELRAKFNIPIIGMEPAVKKAIDLQQEIPDENDLRVLLIATPVTAVGKKLKDLIGRVDTNHLVDVLPLPKLVEFAEKEEFASSDVLEYLNSELLKFNLTNYSSIVLGCTHFNYFKDTLRRILPSNIKILDGNEGTVNKLISELEGLNLIENNKQSVEFFYSSKQVSSGSEITKLKRYLKRLDEMIDIA
ncbi:glutamate racemase [Campylobacter sp. RM12920]|uniref:Glutamate racemase n=1 Tax=Campylobacter californiensis TaxID=1032243 RepID=A0ABD4JGW7_9BACT|nr:glutamate racemase [Campylobacter sp. RM12919]MBE2988320.1 glutamate racemase [Campylobacter sp. RM12920]